MSVRDGLLAILTLGPAYGLQLHSELASRAPHRKPVNVGQIYGTLDRLAKSSLVAPAGTTDDALPLYALTGLGRVAADAWMREPAFDALPEWTEMLDQVLVTTSIDPRRAKALAEDYRRWWESELSGIRSEDSDDFGTERQLAGVAREAQAVAAIAWLGAAIASLADFDTARPLSEVRPKRGRRARSPR
jgi:DNA-binding PadR family transcriptional regulator